MSDLLGIFGGLSLVVAIVSFFGMFIAEDDGKIKSLIIFIIFTFLFLILSYSFSVYSQKIYIENYENYLSESEEGNGILINKKDVITVLQDDKEVHFKTLNNMPKSNNLNPGDKLKFRYVKNKALIIEILENK